MLKNALQIITQTFSPLSEECLADFEQYAQIQSFQKGHQLVKEGQYADKMYFMLNGCAKAFYLKDGKNITDWFAFEHEFICAINSFFLFIPSPHYIELLEDSTLLVIAREDMVMLCDKHHDFERLGRISTTKTLLQLQQRVVSLQFENAQQRYLNLISIYPHIELRVPLGDIASYLGITQETLSRIRASKNRI
jgi:CRP-like cAMP-binding protein